MTFDLEKARDAAKFDDHMAITMFPLAIAEIERLRGEMENYGDDYVCQMNSKDVRIQELEDALVEEGARHRHTTERGSSCKYYKECEQEYGNFCNFDGCPHKIDYFMKNASQQLQAEGKIGPDADAKPQVWQITDERVEALKVATGEMDLSENIFYLNSLKTMLTEADHGKP